MIYNCKFGRNIELVRIISHSAYFVQMVSWCGLKLSCRIVWFLEFPHMKSTLQPVLIKAFVRNTKTCWNLTPTILLLKPGHHCISFPRSLMLLLLVAEAKEMLFKRWIIVTFYRLILLLIFGPSCVGKTLNSFKQFQRDLQCALAFLMCFLGELSIWLAFYLHWKENVYLKNKKHLFSRGQWSTWIKCLLLGRLFLFSVFHKTNTLYVLLLCSFCV